MKRKIFISLLIVSFFNYVGCYTYSTLTKEEINSGGPETDGVIKLILNDGSEIECIPPFDRSSNNPYYLKVSEPGRFLIGSGEKSNIAMNVKSWFEGVIQGDTIDSSKVVMKDSVEYYSYWLKDDSHIIFEKGRFIEITPEQGTGYFLWKLNEPVEKISFSDVKEVQERKFDWLKLGIGTVGIGLLVTLFIVISQIGPFDFNFGDYPTSDI